MPAISPLQSPVGVIAFEKNAAICQVPPVPSRRWKLGQAIDAVTDTRLLAGINALSAQIREYNRRRKPRSRAPNYGRH
jgi:hypothetical protein